MQNRTYYAGQTAKQPASLATGCPAGRPDDDVASPSTTLCGPLLNDIGIDSSEIALFTKLDEGKQRKHKERPAQPSPAKPTHMQSHSLQSARL